MVWVAGRVANRIANGSFTLDGVTYHTPLNDHAYDTLHGGWVGYDRRVWSVAAQSADSVTFSLVSYDGEQGFPGEILINVTHTITDDNEWTLKSVWWSSKIACSSSAKKPPTYACPRPGGQRHPPPPPSPTLKR
jgi:hypothetical protein